MPLRWEGPAPRARRSRHPRGCCERSRDDPRTPHRGSRDRRGSVAAAPRRTEPAPAGAARSPPGSPGLGPSRPPEGRAVARGAALRARDETRRGWHRAGGARCRTPTRPRRPPAAARSRPAAGGRNGPGGCARPRAATLRPDPRTAAGASVTSRRVAPRSIRRGFRPARRRRSGAAPAPRSRRCRPTRPIPAPSRGGSAGTPGTLPLPPRPGGGRSARCAAPACARGSSAGSRSRSSRPRSRTCRRTGGPGSRTRDSRHPGRAPWPYDATDRAARRTFSEVESGRAARRYLLAIHSLSSRSVGTVSAVSRPALTRASAFCAVATASCRFPAFICHRASRLRLA